MFSESELSTARKVMSIFNGFNPEIIKIESGEKENDTLIIGHYSIWEGKITAISIMGSMEVDGYYTGVLVHNYGNMEEPPSDELGEGPCFRSFTLALLYIVEKWAMECSQSILESIHIDSLIEEPSQSEIEAYMENLGENQKGTY